MQVILNARGSASYTYEVPATFEPQIQAIIWNDKVFVRDPRHAYVPTFNEEWSFSIPSDGPQPQPTLVPTDPEPPPSAPSE